MTTMVTNCWVGFMMSTNAQGEKVEALKPIFSKSNSKPSLYNWGKKSILLYMVAMNTFYFYRYKRLFLKELSFFFPKIFLLLRTKSLYK